MNNYSNKIILPEKLISIFKECDNYTQPAESTLITILAKLVEETLAYTLGPIAA